MINYLLILIFLGLIFFIILPKLIKENEFKKFKKINFVSIYLSLFVLINFLNWYNLQMFFKKHFKDQNFQFGLLISTVTTLIFFYKLLI